MIQKRKTIDKIELGKGDALLVIDVQNDFLPGGPMAVTGGNGVIPVLNGYIEHFSTRQLPVFATRDWHPCNHCSFISQGGLWPEHCIAESKGAEFASGLHLPEAAYVISKGTEAEQDGYSGFSNPALKAQLGKAGVYRLFIGGLATDYCVLNTVLDALNQRYQVVLLTDAIRAVNVQQQDGDNAVSEMLDKGATAITLALIS